MIWIAFDDSRPDFFYDSNSTSSFSAIPTEYKSGLAKIENEKFEFMEYSFNEIVKSTLNRALKVIQQSGGSVTATSVIVPHQTAQAPKLEQWDPGIPNQRISFKDPAWTWDLKWTEQNKGIVCAEPGGEAVLHFTGSAIAILGVLNQEGGRAEVYLDGQKTGSLDAYIVDRTHDNVLWHTYGLTQAAHTLRIVTLAERDSRSRGSKVTIERAVVYRSR